jgi:hypothetical protein
MVFTTSIDDLLRRRRAANDLDQPHPLDRREEMQTEEAIGPLQHAREASDRKPRSVAREPGSRRKRRLDAREQRLLQRTILGDALDRGVAICEVAIAFGRPHRRKKCGRRCACEPTACDLALELRRQTRVARARRVGVTTEQDDLDSPAGRDLGDAEPHQSRADDSDAAHGARHR